MEKYLPSYPRSSYGSYIYICWLYLTTNSWLKSQVCVVDSYQNIHKSSVWERTKQVANKAGSAAISILSSIAQNIIMQEIAGLIAQQAP